MVGLGRTCEWRGQPAVVLVVCGPRAPDVRVFRLIHGHLWPCGRGIQDPIPRHTPRPRLIYGRLWPWAPEAGGTVRRARLTADHLGPVGAARSQLRTNCYHCPTYAGWRSCISWCEVGIGVADLRSPVRLAPPAKDVRGPDGMLSRFAPPGHRRPPVARARRTVCATGPRTVVERACTAYLSRRRATNGRRPGAHGVPLALPGYRSAPKR